VTVTCFLLLLIVLDERGPYIFIILHLLQALRYLWEHPVESFKGGVDYVIYEADLTLSDVGVVAIAKERDLGETQLFL
jgi:hypothetical protein